MLEIYISVVLSSLCGNALYLRLDPTQVSLCFEPVSQRCRESHVAVPSPSASIQLHYTTESIDLPSLCLTGHLEEYYSFSMEASEPMRNPANNRRRASFARHEEVDCLIIEVHVM
jgi:hypothetical protein